MAEYELAQLNIARMVAPLESPEMNDFVGNLDYINGLAEQSPGYVWRLQTEDGNATALRPFGENMLVNLSVWKDVESLGGFVYQSAQIEIMRRRKEWFKNTPEAFMVLWWIPVSHIPTVDEAKVRLDHLRVNGSGPTAFTFSKAYPIPDSQLSMPET